MTIEQLRQPVKAEYDRSVQEYHSRMLGEATILNEVSSHLAAHPGKMLRPLLVLLSAKACGTLNDKHILLATAMEMLHNATLMHDDVVDESDTRRGNRSVRGQWGNQVAVLCGDYYLSQTMQLLQQVGDPKATALVAETVSLMTQGELMQLAATRNSQQTTANSQQTTLDEYLKVIGLKTASLMACCCQLGGMERDFGYHYGMLFQMRDDLGSLDPRHDIAIPDNTNPQTLIADHTRLASEALDALPHSEARETLRSLLLPSAPQPS